MAWQVLSVLYAETISSILDLYGMLGECCEILLLLNMADMDYLICGKLWSEQC